MGLTVAVGPHQHAGAGATTHSLDFPRYKQEPVEGISVIRNYCASKSVVIDVDPVIRHFYEETYGSGATPAFDPEGSDTLIALTTAILYREGSGAEVITLGTLQGTMGGVALVERRGTAQLGLP